MMGTACITGASSGIGRAYALALAEAGYRLIITGRRHEKLREVIATAEQLRQNAGFAPAHDEIFTGDLADPEVCAKLASRITETTDLDLLIHNAGFGHQTDFYETAPLELRKMGEVHMQCAVILAHAALPRLTTRTKPGTEATEPGSEDAE
nr:SDR family NAD(P)-dependent oxidoreductase [Spirochaeta sp.]